MSIDEAIRVLNNGEFWDYICDCPNSAKDDLCAAIETIENAYHKKCNDCAGIIYRQTDSGKIVPYDCICALKQSST